MVAAAALGFISLGQTVALMMGGIDLSVGPLAGFLVSSASFFINDGKSVAAGHRSASSSCSCWPAPTGAANGSLIRFGEVHRGGRHVDHVYRPAGVQLPAPCRAGRLISATVTAAVTKKLGPFPIVFLVLVLVTV